LLLKQHRLFWTPETYQQRKDTIKAFGPNTKIGTSINALQTITQHLDTLQKSQVALKNGDLQTYNKIKNMFAKETGAVPGVRFDTINDYLAFELARYYTGGVPTQTSIDDAKKQLGSSASPEQIGALINTTAALVEGKVAAIDYDWKSRMGPMAGMRDPVGKDVRGLLTKLAGDQGHESQLTENNKNTTTSKEQPAVIKIPNAKAIETLKAHPEFSSHFDATFGAGSSKHTFHLCIYACISGFSLCGWYSCGAFAKRSLCLCCWLTTRCACPS